MNSDFTRKKSITKNAEVELIPMGRTREYLDKNRFFDLDSSNETAAEELHPYIDDYIKTVIKSYLEALKNGDLLPIDWDTLNGLSKDDYDKASEQNAKLIMGHMDHYMPEGGTVKGLNSAAFISDTLSDYIKKNYRGQDRDTGLELVEKLRGKNLVLTKYLITRQSTLAKSANRVFGCFDEYRKNAVLLQAIKEEHPLLWEQIFIEYPRIEELMVTSMFPNFATIDGIEAYNLMIAGIENDKGIIKKGINVLVNEYNQSEKTKNRLTIKTEDRGIIAADPEGSKNKVVKKAPALKKMMQQILYARKRQFRPRYISTDGQMKELLQEMIQELVPEKIYSIINLFADYDAEGIFVKGSSLNDLSMKIFGNFSFIRNAVEEDEIRKIEEEKLQLLAQRKPTKDGERKLTKTQEESLSKKIENISQKINDEFYSLDFLGKLCGEDALIQRIRGVLLGKMEGVRKAASLAMTIEGNERYFGSSFVNETANAIFEEIHTLRSIIKDILSGERSDDADNAFYEELRSKAEYIVGSNKIEDLIRNYLTHSVVDDAVTYTTCFGSPLRFNSKWWNGQEPVQLTTNVLLKDKEGKLYLMLLAASKYESDAEPRRRSKSVGKLKLDTSGNGETYMGLAYSKHGDPSKFFPKNAFLKSVTEYFSSGNQHDYIFYDSPVFSDGFTVSREVYDTYKAKTYTKESLKKGVTEEERRAACAIMIEFYQRFTAAYKPLSKYNYSFRAPEEYEDIGTFFDECAPCQMRMEWLPVSKAQVDKLVEDGKVYLFMLHTKELYLPKDKIGTNSMAVRTIFSDKNIQNMELKLNSRPLFEFRPKRNDEPRVVHKKGSILIGRNTLDGKRIPNSIYHELISHYRSGGKTELSGTAKAYKDSGKLNLKTCEQDIIKDAKFYRDMFYMNITYTKNANVSDESYYLSRMVREEIREEKKSTLVISRGYNDMLSYSLYDAEGNLTMSDSLNTLNGINYKKRLTDIKNFRREEQAEAWNYGVTIANYQTNYVRAVAGTIANLAVKNNAVVVLESISEFSNSHFPIINDKVYQTIDSAIEKKLNDYYDPVTPYGDAGSISNPYQMANISTIQDRKSQNGRIFRINMAYTSVCPFTGFANFLNLSDRSTEAMKAFFGMFDELRYDDKYVYYGFDYKNMKTKVQILPDRTKWTVRFGGEGMIAKTAPGEKGREYTEDVARTLIQQLRDGGYPEKKNLIHLIDGMTGVLLKELLRGLRDAVYSTSVYLPDGRSFYRSPICGITEKEGMKDRIAPEEVYAIVMYEKYKFSRLQFEKEDEFRKDAYAADWLNYFVDSLGLQ